MNNTPLITCIIGATGIGKTEYSLLLAKQTGAQIISADAYQVYRYMDIGTAKVDSSSRDAVPHHLIDIKLPDDSYSVVEFLTRTTMIITDCVKHHIPIIICGGNGLFMHAFLYQYHFNSPASNPAIRKELLSKYDSLGKAHLWDTLYTIDPITAKAIHPNNKHHLLRALEIASVTGKKPSDLKKKSSQIRPNTRIIGLTASRSVVKDKINRRVDRMIEQGFVNEVMDLLSRGYLPTLQSFKSIGYQEVIHYLDGRLDYTTMIDLIKVRTHQFSKRQMTWFKKIQNVQWQTISN